MHIPVCYTNRQSIKSTMVMVTNGLLGMGLYWKKIYEMAGCSLAREMICSELQGSYKGMSEEFQRITKACLGNFKVLIELQIIHSDKQVGDTTTFLMRCMIIIPCRRQFHK